MLQQDFTGGAVGQNYVLQYPPVGLCLVYNNGELEPQGSFSVSNLTVTLDFSTTSSDTVSIVYTPGPLPAANSLDLTTVAMVAGYLNPLTLAGIELTEMAGQITSASIYWLWRTGLGDWTTGVPSASPLNAICPFNEWYDGNGKPRMFLRNRPIQTVTSVIVNGITLPASVGYNSAGWAIHQDGKSLIIRNGSNSGYTTPFYPAPGRAGFSKGLQNVNIVYGAGYYPEPADVLNECTRMVAMYYRRRQTIDMKSSAMAAGAGTLSYQAWEVDPITERTIQNYSRAAVIS